MIRFPCPSWLWRPSRKYRSRDGWVLRKYYRVIGINEQEQFVCVQFYPSSRRVSHRSKTHFHISWGDRGCVGMVVAECTREDPDGLGSRMWRLWPLWRP